jgi:hypothetical protein
MPDASTEKLLEVREQRIRDAVALKTPDRVPIIPNGPAWAARATGIKMSEVCTNPTAAYRTMIDAYTGLGEIDGIQHASYHVSSLSMLWLSRVRRPGRELPDDELWQVDESEIMTVDDYDAIVEEGYGPWLERYYAERIPGVSEEFGCWAQTLPEAFAAWEEAGVVVFSPVVVTVPYELFCGGRSMKEFLLDLYRRGDKVQAAMDAAFPLLKDQMRQLIRDLRPMAIWIGGWRSASEFLAPRLWERFVFPYYKEMVDIAVEEGTIPVLHFDANWTRDLARLREMPKGKVVLSLDGKTDIFKAKELLGDHMCLMGDVPPGLLALGTPEDVGAYSRRLIREIGPAGFILSSGCDVPPTAKYENVQAMVNAVKEV